MSLVTLLVVLAILFVIFGWWWPSTGTPENPRSPYWGWGPGGLIILIILVLLVTGNITPR